MDPWDDLAVFLAARRTGSASRAAASLGVSVSTVTRRLARLEEAVGRALFVRTADGLQATPAGDALLPHAEHAEHAMLAGRAAVDALDQSPAGRVTLALPNDMVQLVLLPDLAPLIDAHPGLELVLEQGSGLADLMRREADIAVRVVRPEEGEELVATRLRPVQHAAFGSASYLRAIADPGDPTAHRWLSWLPSLEGLPEAQWRLAAAPGAPVVMRSNNASTIRLGAAAGLGLAVLPRLFGQLTPTLVEVPLRAPPMPRFDLWMVTHRALRYAPRVAAVWAHLDARLRHDPAQDDLAVLRPELAEAYGLRFGDSTANQSSS